MNTIEINGESVPASEASALIRMLCNDAKKFAGEFHNQNRSVKFRANWPNEYLFADANWKTFIEAVRAMYAERLGDPKTPPTDARKMHLAIVLWTKMEGMVAPDPRLQLKPNTQQFVGDKFENHKIVDAFGKQSNTFMELLMSSAAATERFH